MNLEFKPIDVEAIEELTPYFCKRPNKTCDSVILDSYLWRTYYQVRYAVSDNKAIQWLMEHENVVSSAMPVCEEQDLEHYFEELVTYFNEVLHKPLLIHLADEEAVKALKLEEHTDRFLVTEQEDFKKIICTRAINCGRFPGKSFTKRKTT